MYHFVQILNSQTSVLSREKL